MSSRSSLADTSSMDTLIQQSLNEVNVNQYYTPEDNPEAMFDMLTIQTIRDRYQDIEEEDTTSDITTMNGQDFENFVREFTIDDSISECFASADVPDPSIEEVTESVDLSETNSQGRQSKLKKKHRTNQEESVFSDEDSKSSDSKRSKLNSISNLFGKKHKNKEGYKVLKQNDSQEKGKHITDSIIDACENITKSYEQNISQSTCSTSNSKASKHKSKKTRESNFDQTENQNSSDVQNALNVRKLPPVPKVENENIRNDIWNVKQRHEKPEMTSNGSLLRSVDVKAFLRLNDQQLIEKLRVISSDGSQTTLRKTVSTRDVTGMTLLQICVLDDRTNVVDFILETDPTLLDANIMVFAVKHGKTECVRDLLERRSMDGTLNPELIGELLALCSKNGQTDVLETVIPYLETDPPSYLPCDQYGNTAAHLAAQEGHLHCLQILLDNGFDVWTMNDQNESALGLALKNGHLSVYKHLLLYQTCQCLLTEATKHQITNLRFTTQRTANHETLDKLEQQLAKYQIQFNEVMRNMIDTQETILQTVDNMYKDMKRLIQKVDDPNGSEKLKLKLEKLKAEADQLQDLFDFSPLANTNDLLTKVLLEFRKVVLRTEEEDTVSSSSVNMPPDTKELLSSVLRNSATICGQNSQVNIELILNSQVQNLLQMLSDSNRPVSKSTSTASSRSGNHRYKFTQPVYQNPKLEQFLKNSKENNDHKEEANEKIHHNVNSSSSIMTGNGNSERHLSYLPEENVNQELDLPVLDSPSVTDSVCSTVVTSGIMGTEKTDWTSRLGTITCDTSDTESDWWDASHDKSRSGYTESRDEEEEEDDDKDFVTSIRLNLENEDLPDDMLREHRLAKHLQSIEKLKHNKGEFVERVISASGQRVGRWLDSSCMDQVKKVNPDNSKSSRKSKKQGIQLYNPEPRHEMESNSPTPENRRRRWDEMSITDGEESKGNPRPWYEMSDDEESVIQVWKSDDEDNQSQVYRI
ncbi:uncharacterized protein LOC133173775 isoform X2 [Saccostrea echinata]|nr:uncharacterized protein LOC133173775 isoform X2 [Saccostrea echinata]